TSPAPPFRWTAASQPLCFEHPHARGADEAVAPRTRIGVHHARAPSIPAPRRRRGGALWVADVRGRAGLWPGVDPTAARRPAPPGPRTVLGGAAPAVAAGGRPHQPELRLGRLHAAPRAAGHGRSPPRRPVLPRTRPTLGPLPTGP